MVNRFDVIVIGGGPGGYVAAVRASQLGLKTAVVEKEAFGGVCVNWGCIPTKALLRNAEVVDCLKQGRTFGFTVDGLEIDYALAHKRSRQVAQRQGRRIVQLLKKHQVTLLQGFGSLVGPNDVEVQPTGEQFCADNIILATGARSREIPGVKFDGDRIISFREALDLDKFPGSVAIVGGGPIGMEFATIWHRYGAEVHIVEMMPRILPLEDEDVAQEAEHQFIRAGMKIRTGARVETIQTSEKGVVVRFTGEKGPEEIHVEKVLVAAGFVPNIDRVGLETMGVRFLDGRIVVNAQMRTSVEHIFAIGDVNGLMGLAHVASAQGIIASETIAGRKTEPLDYVNIPRCTYTDPEIASVGLTEKQAKEKGGHILAVQSPLAPNGKAVAMNQNVGFVKIIAEADTGKILGAHMVGAHVTELIAGPAGMISMGATVGQMARVIYPHPTLGEAIMEALHALDGCAIHI